MNLTKNKIFFGILIFGLITNFLVLFDVQFLYLRATFSFIFLTTIPGLLTMLLIRIRKIGFWEYLVYTIGLSVAFLMFGGLAVNWTLPWLHITNKPLSLIPLLISYNTILLIFGIIAFIRNKNLSLKIKFPKLNWINKIFFVIPVIFPILSILGATTLNNRGPNYLTMIMFGGIANYILMVIILRKKLNRNIYPLAIYFIATSLLLMTSLRGWYITGHDIRQEYYVFQLTKSNFHWDISLFQDSYNACLSLNILPTIFSSFLNINDMYIYKICFQILFTFSVVSIYLTLKRYTHRSIAFLSAFFFMSFPAFLNDVPMLNRQEIALLLFALMLLVLFNKSLKLRSKEILFSIFGFSMVVSHYSTSYLAVALFILTYLISLIFKSNFFKERLQLGSNNYYLTWTTVLGIVIFSFAWTTQITQTSGGLTQLVSQTWQNIGKSFSQDLKSEGVLYSIFSWQKLDKEALLNEYVATSTIEVEESGDKNNYFDKTTYDKYKISLLEDVVLPLTVLGNKLKSISLDAFSSNYYLRQWLAKITQILIVLGFIGIITKKGNRGYVRNIDSEYIVLIFASTFLLGLLILLPMFSIEYGTTRFFQQTLIILALPTTIGCLMIFNFLDENIRLYLSTAVFIVFFLSLSGFLPQLSGGYYPQLHLNNRGIYYDKFYTHKSELNSIRWLSVYSNKKYPIQSDTDASYKMLMLSNLHTINRMLPPTIRKDAYVYLDYSNVKNSKVVVDVKGNLIIYNYPIGFLDENKDLIYSNLESKIFK